MPQGKLFEVSAEHNWTSRSLTSPDSILVQWKENQLKSPENWSWAALPNRHSRNGAENELAKSLAAAAPQLVRRWQNIVAEAVQPVSNMGASLPAVVGSFANSQHS